MFSIILPFNAAAVVQVSLRVKVPRQHWDADETLAGRRPPHHHAAFSNNTFALHPSPFHPCLVFTGSTFQEKRKRGDGGGGGDGYVIPSEGPLLSEAVTGKLGGGRGRSGVTMCLGGGLRLKRKKKSTREFGSRHAVGSTSLLPVGL